MADEVLDINEKVSEIYTLGAKLSHEVLQNNPNASFFKTATASPDLVKSLYLEQSLQLQRIIVENSFIPSTAEIESAVKQTIEGKSLTNPASIDTIKALLLRYAKQTNDADVVRKVEAATADNLQTSSLFVATQYSGFRETAQKWLTDPDFPPLSNILRIKADPEVPPNKVADIKIDSKIPS